MDKIMRFGFSFFSIILFAFSALKFVSGRQASGIYYFIAGLGFAIAYIGYIKKKDKGC